MKFVKLQCWGPEQTKVDVGRAVLRIWALGQVLWVLGSKMSIWEEEQLIQSGAKTNLTQKKALSWGEKWKYFEDRLVFRTTAVNREEISAK